MASALPLPDPKPLLERYLNRRGPIPWLDWLPVAIVAADSPESLIAALNALSLDQQFELLHLLREAGPLADAIIITLARHAAAIRDDQIRQFLLEDAVMAREHQAEHLRIIRECLEQQVKAGRDREFPDFKLAEEIIRLERELAEIRQQEHDQDERFARLHELEQAIVHLTMRRRILAAYDEAARRRHLEQLEHEINSLQKRKKELENDIARYDKELEVHSRSLSNKQKQLQDKQADLRDVQASLGRLEQQLEAEEAALQAARQQRDMLQARLKEIRGQIKRLEQENKQNEDLLKRESKKLLELQQAAECAKMNDLAERVKEIYNSLPEDIADQALRNK